MPTFKSTRKGKKFFFVMSLRLSDHMVLHNIASSSSFFSISLGFSRFFRSYFVLFRSWQFISLFVLLLLFLLFFLHFLLCTFVTKVFNFCKSSSLVSALFLSLPRCFSKFNHSCFKLCRPAILLIIFSTCRSTDR